MLTNEDIQKLSEVLATKEDMNGLKEIVQGLTLSIDKPVKGISDLKTEYSVIASIN